MSLVVSEINTERFIDEIKLRPCLWDSSSESFKDREMKKMVWSELCSLFYADFEDSTPKEKSEMSKNLQGKWRNIKDCYRKYLRALETKSGQARREVKTYVYAAHLSFLQSTLMLGPSEPSSNAEIADEVCYTQEQYDICCYKEDDSVEEGGSIAERPKTRRTINRRQKKSMKGKLKQYIDTCIASKGSTEEECDDLNFFKSLLPIVKPLPMSDKIRFRVEVMKLAHEHLLKHQQETIS